MALGRLMALVWMEHVAYSAALLKEDMPFVFSNLHESDKYILVCY